MVGHRPSIFDGDFAAIVCSKPRNQTGELNILPDLAAGREEVAA
jgi:hypothetical protein